MKEFLSCVGIALIILSISHCENSKTSQDIENLEKLYQIKEYLGSQKSIQETELYIEDVQNRIDSMETTINNYNENK